MKKILVALLLMLSTSAFAAPTRLHKNLLPTDTLYSDGGGWWIPIASQAVVNTDTITFSGLASSTAYHMEFNLTNSVNTWVPYMSYNDLYTGTAYSVTAWRLGDGVNTYAQTIDTKYLPIGYESQAENGTSWAGKIDFETVYGTSVTVISSARFKYWLSVSQPVYWVISDGYTKNLPGTSLTSVSIFAAAIDEGGGGGKTLSGTVYLYKRMQ